MIRFSILLCVAALSLAPAANFAHAQGQPQLELEHPKLDARACADREQLAFGDAVSLFTRETETTGSGDGSDRLGRGDSVICPPQDLDPNIHAPAPGGGRTPIVPPFAVEPPGTQAK